MNNHLPLVDLSRQHNPLAQEIGECFTRIATQGNFILGHEVGEFENKFSAYCGSRYGIGVASGTDALILALKAIGINPGDSVITVANTFIATALAIYAVGAVPYFIDTDEKTFNMTGGLLEEAIMDAARRNLQIKAVIPVHLYGRPCPMGEILTVAENYGLKVVEDACQAHGAGLYDSIDSGALKRVGTFGHAACFSFFPGKNLGAFGDGGLVLTNELKIAERVRLLRNYGSVEKYIHRIKGGNSRLDTLQAAILLIKLTKLEEWNRERLQAASLYRELIGNEPQLQENIILPEAPIDGKHVYHLFVVRVRDRDKVLAHLHSKQIMAGIHYPVPIHLQEAFSDLGYKPGDLPVTELLAAQILSLPIFPGIRRNEVVRVVEELCEFYS
jgi:dTDP-4-amino-4,6-dideoxygalactose transaminase